MITASLTRSFPEEFTRRWTFQTIPIKDLWRVRILNHRRRRRWADRPAARHASHLILRLKTVAPHHW